MSRNMLSQVPHGARHICQKLRDAGFRAWIVGGCVRDLLLGKTPSDWDVCTDAVPDAMLKVFPRAIPTGIAHGTLTVLVDKIPYEVTTLRGEGAYTDGRRPDNVYFAQEIDRDLARRDFTVNAIALDPVSGEIIDPFGGQADLAAKVLRAVGLASERFSEDGLRVLRAARFAATLGFELHEDTANAIEPTLGTFRKVSEERVRDEWIKTMKAEKPSRAFEIMRTTGILAITCPELLEGVGLEQNKHHAFDVWGHAMACLDASAGDPILRMAALLHDVGKPRSRAFSDKTQDYTFYDHDRIGAEMVYPICTRLRFSNDERDRITHLVRNHLFYYDASWTDAAVRRWVRRVGTDRLEDLYALNQADVRGKGRSADDDLAMLDALRRRVQSVLEKGAALSTKDLAVNGSDLMKELGMPASRALGDLLKELLELVTNEPEKNERSALLAMARDIRGRAASDKS
jgi:tRNA nucleotidyltransferase (CCA-adding enzyme)